MLGNFSCFCCRLLHFCKINFFKKIFQEHYQCQTVWIQIRTDILSVLIWAQTVCRNYQQTTKVTASKEKVNAFTHVLSYCLEDHRDPHMKVGAQWLSGRVLDSRPKGRGFEPHWRHCVVVLEQDTFILA